MQNRPKKFFNQKFPFISFLFYLILFSSITTVALAAGFTQRVADIYSGANGSGPSSLVIYKSRLYFAANAGDGTGTELWAYDGISAPSRIADLRPGVNSSYPQHLEVFNNKLYFAADGGIVGNELWVYDGISAPNQIADISPGISSSDPQYLTVFNNKLYFAANGGDGAGNELWIYDGSNAPSRVVDIYSGASSSDPGYLAVFNNQLYFSADGGDGFGQEFWMYYEDNTPPQVSSTTPANGTSMSSINSIKVVFSEDMTQDGGANATNNSGNFILVEAKDNGFQTTACNATDFIGDAWINIDSATYENHTGAGPFEVTLTINHGAPLPNGSYRLFVCGTTSVTDKAGNKINGGADSIVSFTVSALTTLPQTGFAPGILTQVRRQSAFQAYQDLGQLCLEIPSLDVEAPILGVPRNRDGWELTWLVGRVGWLEGTAFPTWAGNSVLTAHVVDSNGKAGLFANLGKLSYGKEIIISAWGQRYVYQVRSVKTMVKPEDVSAFCHKDYPYLTLVTCKGYDEKSGTYRWRVVVQAVQVRVE